MTSIICSTPAIDVTVQTSYYLSIIIDDSNVTYTVKISSFNFFLIYFTNNLSFFLLQDAPYVYHLNPEIDDFSPTDSILSGEYTVTLTGTNLDAAKNPIGSLSGN